MVEYCSAVWSSCNTGLITKLESVKRRLTKSLSDRSSISYSERLCLLNLDSLEKHHFRADLMFFTIMKGFVDVEHAQFYSITRNHRYKLVYTNDYINVRQHFFAVRTILIWNYLSSTVEVESISCFKSRPSKENLTKFVSI